MMNRGDWIAMFIGLMGCLLIIGTAYLVLTSTKSMEVNDLAITINYAPAFVTFMAGLIVFAWSIYFVWPVKKNKEGQNEQRIYCK